MGRKDISEQRKPEILEAYYEVLIEEGIEGASIKKIADRMGIHPSHILHYFKNKEEMAVSLMDHFINLYETEYLAMYDPEKNPKKRLDIIINEVLFPKDFMEDTHRAISALKYLATRNSDIAAALETMYDRFKKHLITELRNMVNSGIIAENDPEKLAFMLMFLSSGYKEIQALKHKSPTHETFYSHTINKVMEIINTANFTGKAE